MPFLSPSLPASTAPHHRRQPGPVSVLPSSLSIAVEPTIPHPDNVGYTIFPCARAMSGSLGPPRCGFVTLESCRARARFGKFWVPLALNQARDGPQARPSNGSAASVPDWETCPHAQSQGGTFLSADKTWKQHATAGQCRPLGPRGGADPFSSRRRGTLLLARHLCPARE
jgi:hypothetical protein